MGRRKFGRLVGFAVFMLVWAVNDSGCLLSSGTENPDSRGTQKGGGTQRPGPSPELGGQEGGGPFRDVVLGNGEPSKTLGTDPLYPHIGDANEDGRLDGRDLAAVELALSGTPPLPFNQSNADIYPNGKLDLLDLVLFDLYLDGTPISVYFQPADGATVSGYVPIYAEQIFSVGLVRITLTLDGETATEFEVNSTTPSPTWLKTTLVSTYAENHLDHKIGIIATSQNGKRYHAQITIHVENPDERPGNENLRHERLMGSGKN